MSRYAYILALTFLLDIGLNVPAAGRTYTTIDYPGAPNSFAVDINDSGQIVGEYQYGASLGTQRYGYLFSDGVFTPIIFPGASFTRAVAINCNGDIVGDYVIGKTTGNYGDFGYLLHAGLYTSIRFPNSDSTIPAGINANGDTVGWYLDKTGMHGFLLSGGVYTSIDFPGSAAFTQAWKINDSGEIVGRYEDANVNKHHMFVLSNGSYTSIPDVPGAFDTAVIEDGGLNNAGHIVSQYCTSKPCGLGTIGHVHGFFLTGGVYTTFDVPGATATMAFGINSSDQIAGAYADLSGTLHGYFTP